VATDLLWAFFNKINQTSDNSLNNELDSLTSLVCANPGYPEARQNWNDNVSKRCKVCKMHPMAAAHEVALVTKLIGAITKIEVNPNIVHPLSFSSIIQDMDDWHEAGNAPDLHQHLMKLDTYILKFHQRTQESTYKIEQPSAFACTECFSPHDIKDCTKVKLAVKARNSNMLSNHCNKGRNNSKGGRRNGYNRNAGQGSKSGVPIQPYQPYQQPNKGTNFKRPYPNKFQSHTNKQVWKKQANSTGNKNWARSGKGGQGAPGNYKEKAENYAPD